MKKILILLIASITIFSCELPNSGRMAVIDFNFNQPDIIKEAIVSDVPDRIIPIESNTVVVVMYPKFSDDTISTSNIPSAIELDSAMSQPKVKTLYINFDSGFSGGSLNNIEPGTWNFVVLTFDDAVSDLTAIDPETALTWRVNKDVEITAGLNLVDLPLKLNETIYEYIPIAYYRSNGAQTDIDEFHTSTYLALTDMYEGKNRIYINPLLIASLNAKLLLYSEEGYLINSTTTLVSSTEAYIEFDCPDTYTSYQLIIGGSYSNGNMLVIKYDATDQSDLPSNSHRLEVYDGGGV